MKIRSLLPSNAKDPAGQFKNIRQAEREIKKRMAAIIDGLDLYLQSLKQLQVQVNSAPNYRYPTKLEQAERQEIDKYKPVYCCNEYVYQLDAARYTEIDSFLGQLLDRNLLDGDPSRFWLSTSLNAAYTDAATDFIDDIQNSGVTSVLSEPESTAINALTVDRVMYSLPTQRRLSLIYARNFNEMKGLTYSMRVDLAETMTRAMLDGDGIQSIAKKLRQRVGVGASRALRIARTEILNTYRTATRDESATVNEQVFSDSPYHFQQLWFSALAATSRKSHVARHGLLYDADEVKEFYAVDGNAINCLCTQRPVLVNKKTGEAIQQKLIDKLLEQKKSWQAGVGR